MATANPSSIVGNDEASGLQPLPSSTQHDKPLNRGTTPLLSRLRYFLRIWSMKITISLVLRFIRLAAIVRRRRDTLPTYTKTYPSRPTLANRMFIPKSHKPGTTHPLLVMIHGGGFALCDPSLDDFFNRALADAHDLVIVSVNYRKSPSYAFPIPVHDAAEITRAVLADTDLPVDLSRKASLGGFSAGGNLALAIAQLSGIKERIGSLVSVYPVVDFTGKFKGEYLPGPDGKEDRLKSAGPVFTWAYLNPGQDLSDPLLSPICVNGREALPQRIFFVGAEHDYLCHEAEIMARTLAFGRFEVPNDKVGDLGDEWERNGIKWRNVKGVAHGWTHTPETGERKVVKINELKKLYDEIAEWVTGW